MSLAWSVHPNKYKATYDETGWHWGTSLGDLILCFFNIHCWMTVVYEYTDVVKYHWCPHCRQRRYL